MYKNSTALPLVAMFFLLGSAVVPVDAASPANPSSPSKLQSSVQSRPWIRVKKVKRENETKGKVVSVSYPKFFGSNTKAIQQLNANIKHLVNGNMPSGPANTDEPDRPEYTYSCDYEISQCNPDIVSGILNFYSFEGGAHGSSTKISFNYELTPQGTREITIDTVFGRKPDLKRLQKLIRARLEKDLYPEGITDDQLREWIETGTESLDLLSNISLDKDGITFNFQNYQVACYAAGQPAVKLKFSELRPLFSSESPVYKFVLASKR